MSLRLRLALWYGALTALVVLALSGAAYVVHGRTLYEDVDRALADDAAHFAPVLDLVSDTTEELTARRSSGQVTAFVRLYDSAGMAIAPSGPEAHIPPVGALEALRLPGGPAYSRVLASLPGGGVSAAGSFATVETATGARARVYVLPVRSAEGGGGYVQTWSSLASIDRSASRFRWLLAGLGGAGVLAVVGAAYAVSGPAVRPVGAMIRTADAIARSRDFHRRVPEPATPRGDELGDLARTFNEMLASLEASYVTQQRFVADAAHELRAPLTAVIGNIELLDRVHDMPEDDRREAIVALRSQAGLLSRLVDDLLQLARSDAGQGVRREPVALHEVVTRTVADLRATPDVDRISLDALEPLVVDGDGDRLRQAFGALLDNARKYTPPPGGVHVSLRRERDEAVLTVSDRGIGIAADDLPRVFERFFRAPTGLSRDPGGTGLGLAIAQSVVSRHGGHIAIESEVGRGTTVTVRIPLAPAGDRRSARASRTFSGPSADARTVDSSTV